MRIVAGKHRSRKIESVNSAKTRSTLDQVKESLFQRIGPFFEGGTFLDLFAGSGNIGLEAISRGIAHATFVDNQVKAIETINKNISALHEDENATVIKKSYRSAINQLKTLNKKFDYIYLDPPYKFEGYEDLLQQVSGLIKEQGLILLEVDKTVAVKTPIELECCERYEYRTACILVYRVVVI